ncbi:hypothetical protein RUMCAL_02492 [Ruminococcus callidus ATCC 27760]|uniref:Uncharacterized protein n=1 Tax=Ruminococcus callidus ATCC 27760 TaxID=411473 RepID=U2KIV4_9FIRM|nr:hypothetical protein RUMCAL_02492 [Ruminococcus callidus ATCC 27760]
MSGSPRIIKKETLHKARRTALHQSAKKSDDASYAQALSNVS